MMHRRYPITDRERDRATIQEVVTLTAVAIVIAGVIWWVWFR